MYNRKKNWVNIINQQFKKLKFFIFQNCSRCWICKKLKEEIWNNCYILIWSFASMKFVWLGKYFIRAFTTILRNLQPQCLYWSSFVEGVERTANWVPDGRRRKMKSVLRWSKRVQNFTTAQTYRHTSVLHLSLVNLCM